MIKFKFWFSKNYWWLFIGLVFILIIFASFYEPLRRINAIVAVLTILISSLFFIQKQKLEELKIFIQLFKAFNKRYDKLNDHLNVIMGKTEPLEDEEKQKLYDYFNLCGEEYFYYKQGYISPEVWESWLNGMKYFYKDSNIKRIWNEELELNSYYKFKKSLLEN
jgi:hypothetical protein